MNKTEAKIEINELVEAGVELNGEELMAVSGGKWRVTWTCGSKNLADEWAV